jgi:transcriptional regulator with XRE-family HTH domain
MKAAKACAPQRTRVRCDADMQSKPVILTPDVLGARIAQALEKNGKSRELAADAIGKSRATLDRYISGKKNPSAIDIWNIAQLTGVPFAWFGLEISEELDGEGRPMPAAPPSVDPIDAAKRDFQPGKPRATRSKRPGAR